MTTKYSKKKEVKIAEPQVTEDSVDTEEVSDVIETTEHVDQNAPKKRGRKPKNKVVEPDADENKIVTPKKRGRRPKDKTYTVISNYKEIPTEIEDDNVVLHLPIETNFTENDTKIETNGVLRYDPHLNEPAPYEPMNSMKSGFALISDKLQEKLNEINEIEENNDTRGIINEVKSATKCSHDEVNIRDIGFEEDNKDYFRVLKKAKILKLIECDGNKKEWNLATDTCCYYCTEKFETVPVGIPVRYFRGKFFCRDNFCSFNCAAAYIFLGVDIKYHFRKWEYYSLLCLLAWQIKKAINESAEEKPQTQKSMKVKLAEDRNLLKKFGGPLSIDQFRKNFYVLDKQYSLHYPPQSSMYPQAEVANYVNVHRQKAQMLNNDSRFNNTDTKSQLADLRLKREKPLIQKKNTLEEYMSLKIS